MLPKASISLKIENAIFSRNTFVAVSTRIRSHTATPSSSQSRATSTLIHGPHWLVQMAILLSQEAHCSMPQVSPAGQVSTP